MKLGFTKKAKLTTWTVTGQCKTLRKCIISKLVFEFIFAREKKRKKIWLKKFQLSRKSRWNNTREISCAFAGIQKSYSSGKGV